MHRQLRKRLRALLVISTLLTGLFVLAPAQTAEAQASGCPTVGANFGNRGPFSITTQSTSVTTFYSPSNLGSQGCTRHPVIVWGNGTFTTPSWYGAMLEHWASHGFIVAAANTSNAGTGQEMRAGIDQLTTWNGQSGNRFNGRVDLGNIAASGHSQGGAGTHRAGGDDQRITSIFPIQGGGTVSNVETVLSLAGTADPFVTQMQTSYNQATSQGIAAAFLNVQGANHLTPLGDGGNYRQVTTAWVRFILMGDSNAAQQFQGANCGYCSSGIVADYRANAQLQAWQGGGGPGNGDPGPAPCFTATNSQHRDAGRATGFLVLSAVGSGDSLGLWTATTSLRQTGPGVWSRVGSC